MATQILIIWPHADQAEKLYASTLRSGLDLSPKLLERYPDRRELMEIVADSSGPKAVVIGMTRPEAGLQLLDCLRQEASGVVTAAAHHEESAELMRAAMRTGARDFLLPPFPRVDIQRIFHPIAAKPDKRPEGALVAVTPCRGNDGASTIALHLAQAMGDSAGRPALLVDCDVQCGITGFRLGLQASYSLADALAHADNLDELMDKIVVHWRGFDLVVAPDSSLGLLSEHLDRLPQVLAVARRSYEVVIADMPPGLYMAGLEVMRAAETVYLVCTPDLASLHMARRRVSELLQNGIEKAQLRVILNRSGSGRAVTRPDIERVIGTPLFFELANDYDAVHRAAVAGGLVARESDLGRDLGALAARIRGSGAPAEKHEAPGWKRMLRLP